MPSSKKFKNRSTQAYAENIDLVQYCGQLNENIPSMPVFSGAVSLCTTSVGESLKSEEEKLSTAELNEKPRRMYVSNLPQRTSMKQVCDLFPEAVRIELSLRQNEKSNSAVVEFKCNKDLRNAYKANNQKTLGKKILVMAPLYLPL